VSVTLTADARAALYAPETSVVFTHLLTFDSGNGSPVRLVSDLVDWTSRGETYTAFAYEPLLPPAVPGELPTFDMVADNVGRDLVAEVRSLDGPATVTIEVVTSADPDEVERGPWVMDLTSTEIAAGRIRLSLSSEALWSEPYPVGLVTPPDFPLAFRAPTA
jgi:hypothetical protein